MKHPALICAVLTALAVPAHAQQSTADQAAQHPAQTQDAETLTEGEVRKIILDANKITIRHGPIPILGMPGMTMVFQVSEPALLDKVKTGDRIRFRAEKSRGAYVVTRIEPAK